MVVNLLNKLKSIIQSTRQNEYLSEVTLLNFSTEELELLSSLFSNVDDNFNLRETEIVTEILAFLIKRDYNTPIPENLAIKIINQLMVDITIASMVKRGLVKIVDIDENNQWTVELTDLGKQLSNTIN